MTPIHSTANLASIIRRQVDLLAQPVRRRVASSNHERPTGAPEDAHDVASLVARRVQALDPADPDRHQKAFRIFLESVLLAEFGGHLINDVGFHQLVSDVQTQMWGDAELALSIQAATQEMLRSAA